VDGRRILALADRADELLTGLIGTVAAVLLGAEVVMALTGGLAGVLLCAVLAVLLLLRSRPLPGRRQRLPLLVAGTVGVALVTTALFLAASPLLRVTVVPAGLLVVAVIALVYGLGVAGRRISPVWGRLLDIVELLLIVAVVPLAAWLCGLYGWIRAIGG